MNNFKILLISLILSGFFAYQSNAQTYLISDEGELSVCTGTLYDSGGEGSNYGANENYTMVLCSDNGSTISLDFTQFNLQNGDLLSIYNGVGTTSLIASGTGNELNGQTITSLVDCLTLVFTSDGGTTSTGFAADISCSMLCQGYTADLVTDPPITNTDSMFLDICPGTEVTFNAVTDYFNNENEGYFQSDATTTFTWKMIDGNNDVVIDQEAENLTSITHTFNESEGYLFSLQTTDSEGCWNMGDQTIRIRVSVPPTFEGTSLEPDPICPGETVNLTGQIQTESWYMSVIDSQIVEDCIDDFTGVVQEWCWDVNAFQPGQSISSGTDLESVCLNIEHSFMGDLYIWVECPNGQQAQIHEYMNCNGAYFGIPGNPNGPYNCTPGEGWDYCWSMNASTPHTNICSSGSSLPSDTYLPMGTFDDLIGCPINGEWCIVIIDNWAADDGTLFQVDLNFSDNILPQDLWGYENEYDMSSNSTDVYWDGNNMVDDTGPSGSATPMISGDIPYTFYATDDFGCVYDHTITVEVLPDTDPDCCIEPDVSAGEDDEICSTCYDLEASDITPGNTGEWTMVSGSGIATFNDQNNPQTQVCVNDFGAYEFEWTESYLGNQACQSSETVTIDFLESYDPTLTPVDDMCISEPSVQIVAIDYGSQVGGSITASPNPAALSDNHIFNPEIAGPGVHTITNTVFDPCTNANQTSEITIEVFGEIQVANFTDQECDLGTVSYFTVEFDVLDYYGDPASSFMLNGASSNQSAFSEEIESPDFYGYTITDFNGCSEVVIDGYRDCGCPLYAGTMESTQTQVLCADECSGEAVNHNGDQEVDGGAIFEFMIHAGDNVPLAYSNNTNFCMHDFGGSFNTIYYVSAIVGFDNGSGHPNITPPGCYSVAVGTPIMWMENPIANAGPNRDTCGLMIQLSGNTPEPGMYGFWSSECNFFTVGGTSYTNPNAIVMATEYNDCIFTWNIVNGECVDSDDVLIRFMETPSPYAGENQTVCGNCVELEATPSVGGNVSWSGPGVNFSDPNSLQTEACVNFYGTYSFTVRESNGACQGSDYVVITFVEEPSPSIATATDTVCGNNYQLSVMNVQGSGSWTANVYNEDTDEWETMTLAPSYVPDNESPDAQVTIGNYTGNSREIQFVWTETNQISGVQCTGSASKKVVFGRIPTASVGANDQAEVCGTSFTFSGDVTGSDWAVGTWNSKIPSSFDDPSDPFTTATLDQVPGAFGDSARVEVPYYWIMSNPDAPGCMSMDTMWVTYYRQPTANAGINNAICGNDYNLGAVYSLSQSDSYSPSGEWSTYSRPIPTASANIQPQFGDSVSVTVSTYGIWQFEFRENNSNATFCYDTSIVTIEFVEIPVVDAGPDKNVCGQCTDMEASSSGFSGSWIPSGQSFPNDDFDNPNAYICVNNYGPRDFVWQESNMAETSSLACTSTDTVTISFFRVPHPEILTDDADSTTCGLTFNNLRALNPGSGLNGVWWNNTDPDPVYGDPNHWNTNVQVTTYGYHDFYWIVSSGPSLEPDFCVDTAGPLRIHFIEIPEADAGGDTLFCGYSGSLSANPSVGTGVWSTPSTELITFEDANNPNSPINSQVLTGGSNPYFNIIWTEDNTNGCTDRDTIKVRFARVPSSEISIVPPKCFGEPATISAKEDSLQEYSWNFYSGIIDSIAPENNEGGLYEHFVYWTNQDTSHQVSLVATNFWGCQSLITIDTVFEPPIPEFDVIIVNDTCLLDRGGIIFVDTLTTNAFYWIDSTVGPIPGTPINAVYNLPAGEYPIRARYRTINQQWYNYYIQTFGNANCTDTMSFLIEPIGLMEAMFEIPPSVMLDELVAPEANVTFNNTSDYAGVRRRCIWNFGDGNTLTSCDEQVEHTYTEANCYEPFLIIMNRDLQECRDTAFIDFCIEVDNQSELEVPNIFTPNGDGINDFFQVKAETLKSFQGYIVNRWGTVVYEWSNWQDEEAGWDGKLTGGTNASSGVYYYIINAVGMDDVEYEEQGALHLMR